MFNPVSKNREEINSHDNNNENDSNIIEVQNLALLGSNHPYPPKSTIYRIKNMATPASPITCIGFGDIGERL